MNRRKGCWTNGGTKDEPCFSFNPPSDWSNVRVSQERKHILEILRTLDSSSAQDGEHGWIGLARKLPMELRQTIVQEVDAGNTFERIDLANWPTKGSIVVNLGSRTMTDASLLPTSVYWRKLDDPHYCDEEWEQKVGDIVHLIIC